MRLLVTGAAGFIGSNFVRFWRAHRPMDEIVGLDLLTYAAVPENLDGLEVELVRGDIADVELMTTTMRSRGIDTVVNFAAESHNSLAIVDPGRFVHTNVMGTFGAIEGARRAGVSRFHHISTCEVYGELDLESPLSFTEQSAYRPRTPYNATKASADHLVRSYFYTYGLPITITNCCNNYGPFQFPEKVIPLFTTNALRGIPLPVYRSSSNRREWIHVSDHCVAIAEVLLRGEIGETYNVGTGTEISVDALADKILEITGRSLALKSVVPDRPSHDRRYLLDSTKLRTTLGWNNRMSFDVGLRGTVEWYTKHQDWWEPLLRRVPVRETNWRP